MPIANELYSSPPRAFISFHRLVFRSIAFHSLEVQLLSFNSTDSGINGNGVDDMGGDSDTLRPLVLGIITTIRVKLDILEADVERVNTLEELNNKKHYLHVLQEITKILAAFPR
jgi:hypothetical protein